MKESQRSLDLIHSFTSWDFSYLWSIPLWYNILLDAYMHTTHTHRGREGKRDRDRERPSYRETAFVQFLSITVVSCCTYFIIEFKLYYMFEYIEKKGGTEPS